MTSGAGHAGDLTPEQAMDTLSANPSAILVDVRTTTEWENVGVVDLSSIKGTPVLLQWLTAPAMSTNPAFASDLKAELERRGADETTPVLFLCRSGARSTAAAITMAVMGFSKSYNISGGFEGSPGQGLPGWRTSGLPWTIG